MDFLVSYLQVLVFVLISVAFLTLLERKVLSYTQLRKGPNKLFWLGVLQPFSDAIKLFSKEDSAPNFANLVLFWVAPLFGFLITAFVWLSLPISASMVDLKYGLLFFLCCISVSVYGIIFSGWASNSKYALLGGLRAVAQTISYEVVLAFIFVYLMFYTKSLSFVSLMAQQNLSSFLFCSLPVFIVLFISCVVETNRAPFDLAEGESELVSGFNVEYGGLKFALIFMAEYASIIWMCILSSLCFWGGFPVFFTMFIMIMFLILRASFPRIRYDELMSFTWKKALSFMLVCYVVVLAV